MPTWQKSASSSRITDKGENTKNRPRSSFRPDRLAPLVDEAMNEAEKQYPPNNVSISHD